MFVRHGYTRASLKELSVACKLSAPALYRYFPSKRDLALHPLSASNRPDRECLRRASADPLVQLRVWLDHAAWERPDFLLALRLAVEIGDGVGITDEHRETLNFHTRLVAELICGVAPRLSEVRAIEVAESLLALSLGADALGLDWPPTTAWTRFVRLLGSDLVRSGADAARVREVLSAQFRHPSHGPCSIELAANACFFDIGRSHLTGRRGRA